MALVKNIPNLAQGSKYLWISARSSQGMVSKSHYFISSPNSAMKSMKMCPISHVDLVLKPLF